MNAQKQVTQQQHNQDITHKILLAIKDIRFGSVEVVIYDSKVVQIEHKGKVRLDPHQSKPSQEEPMTNQRYCRS